MNMRQFGLLLFAAIIYLPTYSMSSAEVQVTQAAQQTRQQAIKEGKTPAQIRQAVQDATVKAQERVRKELVERGIISVPTVPKPVAPKVPTAPTPVTQTPAAVTPTPVAQPTPTKAPAVPVTPAPVAAVPASSAPTPTPVAVASDEAELEQKYNKQKESLVPSAPRFGLIDWGIPGKISENYIGVESDMGFLALKDNKNGQFGIEFQGVSFVYDKNGKLVTQVGVLSKTAINRKALYEQQKKDIVTEAPKLIEMNRGPEMGGFIWAKMGKKGHRYSLMVKPDGGYKIEFANGVIFEYDKKGNLMVPAAPGSEAPAPGSGAEIIKSLGVLPELP